MLHDQTFCTVCDHKIVPDIACDGMPVECPSRVPHTEKQQVGYFAVTIDRVTGEKDSDCVKGID